MIKYVPFVLFALCIDGLQALMSFAFLAMGSAMTAATPIGGAIIGCTIGAATATGVVATATNCVKGALIGAVASPAGAPLGIAIGMGVNICISLTFGVMLVLALAYCGMFYPGKLAGGMFFEIIPGLDAIPGWTTMTITCVLQKMKEDGALEGTAFGALTKMLSPQNALGKIYGGVQAVQQRNVAMVQESRVPTEELTASRAQSRQEMKQNLKNIDGVTARPKTGDGVRSRTNYAV